MESTLEIINELSKDEAVMWVVGGGSDLIGHRGPSTADAGVRGCIRVCMQSAKSANAIFFSFRTIY